MGLFDSNSSTSTSLTEQVDRRLAVGEGGSGISGDSNTQRITVTNNSTTTTLSDSAPALNFAGDVVNAAGNVVRAALDLSADAVRDALTANTQANDSALSYSANTLRDALDATRQAQRDALDAVSRAADSATQSATSSARSALDYGDKLTANVLTLADRSQGRIADSAADSLGFAQHIVDRALDADLRVQQAFGTATEQVARAYDTATNYQAEKSTADNRYLIAGIFAAVALIAIKALA